MPGLNFFYVLVFLITLWSLISVSLKFFWSRRASSRGQKLYMQGILFFLASGIVASIQSLLGVEGFRWGYPLFIVGVIHIFLYQAEPKSEQRKRVGRSPFDPKGPGEQ